MYLNDKYLSVGWLGQREKWFLMLIDNACQPIFESRVKTGKKDHLQNISQDNSRGKCWYLHFPDGEAEVQRCQK